MKKNIWKPFLILLALLYLLISVGRVVYQSYSVNKEIGNLKTEIEDLRNSNKQLSEQILYYQSPSYREKIARERMGLQKPGEEVMVILPEEKPKEVNEDPSARLSNPQKWWNFFFKNE